MRLSEIERLSSFALLGPGFGGPGSKGGDFVFLSDLRLSDLREGKGSQSLVFVEYEQDASEAANWTGVLVRREPVFDVPPARLQPAVDAGAYADDVAHIRAAIAAGDVYQVNLTLRAALPPVSGAALFAAFCRRGVPPFAAWARFPDGREIVSASPELFFAVDGRTVRAQPMKGTAGPRAADALLRSEKDKAELAMITDLLRNDLTRVCEPRSVRVDAERRLLELPYAVQAVSDISGTLQPTLGVQDVLAALHPGGSITGAPKQAARRMIAGLEATPRGAYCGALGWVEGDRAVFSLLIRTAARTTDGWSYGVGSGIVWDSNPEAERAEIDLKLGVLR